MSPDVRRRNARPPRHADLRVLVTRLPVTADRPIPTEEELESLLYVDPARDRRIRQHVEPWLGPAPTTLHDTYGHTPIDVAVSAPDRDRPWGACFTIGASGWAMPAARARPRRTVTIGELYLRVPAGAFEWVDGEFLEPFDSPWDAVIDALVELGRLPHDRHLRFRAPQIVATPGLTPIVPGLPFAGVWLRDGATQDPAVPVLRDAGRDLVTFLAVTFLHPSEIQGLVGPDRLRAAAELDAARVDDLLRLGRPPML